MAKELLDRILGTDGHSHKDMAGTIVDPHQFQVGLEEYGCRLEVDPSEGGGFIYANGSGPVAYIRSPYWRAVVNDPNLRITDIRPVFIQPKESATLEGIQTGAEFEMFVWNPMNSDSAPVMGPGSPIPHWLEERSNGNGFVEEDTIFPELNGKAKKIGFSDELINSCIELNFHHSSDTKETAMSMARALRTLAQGVEQQGWLLTPIASLPHKPLKPEDTNQNPYVQRIAMGYMGWENVRHFIGSSWQVHVEMINLESSLKAINLYQQVSPLMYGLSLAGPFAHGQTDPNLKEIYSIDENNRARFSDAETYKALDSRDWLSIRYPARWRGSPSGGVFTEPAPEDPQEFFAKAEAGLRDNEAESSANIPSPARTMGHHRDRIRVDIKDHGTLEISNQDTYGGHVAKLAANQEFTRVLMWKLQVFAKEGGLNELVQEYPELFNYPVTSESLRQAHLSSIEIAKRGMDSMIPAANGTSRVARDLFYQLMNFVNQPLSVPNKGIDYQGLPQGINRELYNSSLNPEGTFVSYTDSHGITSCRGFYESGVGTLSHWLKRRAQELMTKGLSSEDAIKDTMRDLGESYHNHLQEINGQVIANLFS
ncbi:hypothetical protein A2715_01485 [Candidatus Woesebacteria bacterium RIFCSPHIGHO2_01_FULL_39_32]|uniref:Glutamate--cysteine ligase n=2 Tax=Candidatus Woeseibacteriota TaxID=1752722 RepID=A0A0G0PRB2_9BACT|nr:MAG: hypothetical protein UT61_C0003G0002 [Candidatus Woesebacteria bacterium GW2011_GWA1_39_8]OGM04204.1 MAG: hypothetical protein A2124_02025 [Candidatus Woesebacteria bacterium GWB1_37_5]OGM23834.1 MAG: hypothetical protein A2715_01485 [Candidatus Woesebacteria bacterium RIFCSPHIGHO2_01_FULL_39_32]OGM35717.1 MAG: hypothetical protein A3F01_02215 [Candidatus Woesebacteria bacterium RIFCSPHIGHO2_12_FULL_38_11]OGM64022.1 MAG: hypothetical protein A2893_02725 [Candidatus Woesebacteria bacteri